MEAVEQRPLHPAGAESAISIQTTEAPALSCSIVVDDVDGNQEPEEAIEPETEVSQPSEAAAGSSNKDELDKRVKQMQVEAESRKNEFAKLLEEHAQVIKELKQMEDEPPAPGPMQA